MDVWHGLLNWVDHNRWKILGIVLTVGLIFGMTSCEPSAAGLKGEKVTPAEFRFEVIQADKDISARIADYEAAGKALQAEVEALNQQIAETEDSFERQLEFKEKFIEIAGGIATSLVTGGTVDLASVVMSSLALLGILGGAGAIADSKRKDRVIKTLSEKPPTV